MKEILEFQKLLREEMKKKLMAKTGWGRNEILTVFEEAGSDAIIKLLEKSSR